MACCYIAASMIAFIIHSCEALDIDLHLQYNDSAKRAYDEEADFVDDDEKQKVDQEGVTVVSISGMTCGACTSTVESALLKVQGVQQALVSLPFQEARVFHDAATDREQLVEAIENCGYEASTGERGASQKVKTLSNAEDLKTLRVSLRGLISSSMAIFGLGKGLDWISLDQYFQASILPGSRSAALFLITVYAAARYGQWIFKDAANAAKKGRVNMHTLISVSTVLGLSLTLLKMVKHKAQSDAMYFDSVVGILLIIIGGRYMDIISRRKATDTFAGLYSLMGLTSSVKLSKLDGKRVPTSIVRSGDEIIVEAFNIVPIDSYVVAGSSHVNEAVIIGEPLPKPKKEGDLLLAGSRNGPDQLRAMVNQDYQGSFLFQLVRSIESSLTSKVSAQQSIDVITQYFVSVIFAIAAGAGTYTFLLTDANSVDTAGRKMMTILAAACPCALGLATPCAVMAGIDIAWRKGILMLEGGETMERLKDITHVVMDKTGTLTRGTLTVSDMATSKTWRDNQKVLAVLICAAEEQGMSAHPLALAIFRMLLPMAEDLWRKYQGEGGVRDLTETGGRGVRCEVDVGDGQWREVCVGNNEFMRENNIKGVKSLLQNLNGAEGSIVFVGVYGEIAASMALQDILRPDAKATIDALKARGLDVSMLTGDNSQEAFRISRQLNIPVMAAHATPDAKLQHVKNMQQKGHKVIMIGDGMNDGPSLAAADVGAMMAHSRKCLSSGGSVLLLRSQLTSLLTLLDISKSTIRQVSINIAWAMTYNIVAVALAIGLGSPFGLSISPTIAAAMMSVSSVFITMQGLLLRQRLSKQHNASDGEMWWS